MKNFFIMTLFPLFLLLAGCEYEVPLTSDGKMPIKNELLGLWEFVSSPEEENPEKFRMLVLKQNDTEYMIRYGEGTKTIYLRAYHVELNDLSSLIQTQCIGFRNKPVDIEEKSIYHLVKYRLKENNLEIKVLNADIIDKNCKSNNELKEKILANKNNKELFHNPGIFRKISR